MTSTAFSARTFGKRGNGLPQKSRIVASVPVTRHSAPLAKPPESKPPDKKSVLKPSENWTAPAAVYKAITAARAAFKHINVATVAAVQHAKSAVTNFRAARALAKARSEASVSNAESADLPSQPELAGPPLSIDDTTLKVAAQNPVVHPILPEFDVVAELVGTDPEPWTEAVAFSETTVTPEPAPQDRNPSVADAEPEPTPLQAISFVDAAAPGIAEPMSADAIDPASTVLAFPHCPAAVTVPEEIIHTGREQPDFWRDADDYAPETPSTEMAPAIASPTKVVADGLSTQSDLFVSHEEDNGVAPASASEDWIWFRAYALASAAAFPSALALTCLLGGPTNPLEALNPLLLILLAAVSPPLGLVFFLPAAALVHLQRLARLPPGLCYILAGGVLGSSWLLLNLYDAVPPPLAAYCCIVGGLIGGCVFWRTNRRNDPVTKSRSSTPET